MTDIDALTTGLGKVRDNFVRSLPERENAVRALSHEIETIGVPGPSEEHARQTLHRIAGTAATLGFIELGKASCTCEDELLLVKSGRAYDAERVARLLQDVLHHMVKAQT